MEYLICFLMYLVGCIILGKINCLLNDRKFRARQKAMVKDFEEQVNIILGGKI